MIPMVSVKGLIITGGPQRLKRGTPIYVRYGLQATVKYWHGHFRGKHFRGGAQSRYGYKPRSRRYETKKRRKLGYVIPLVYTGMAKRMAALPPDVRGTSSRATAKMSVPWYFNMTPTRRNAPALGQELIRTTAGEANAMGKFLLGRLVRSMDKQMSRDFVRV